MRSMRLFADRVMPHFQRGRPQRRAVMRPAPAGLVRGALGAARRLLAGRPGRRHGLGVRLHGRRPGRRGGGARVTPTPRPSRRSARCRRPSGSSGSASGHVVKTGVYLADMAQWEAVARAHREAFGEVRPACTWVECGTMIHPDMLVEIDAIAVE